MSEPTWTTTCLNCGAALNGAFCGACGQHAVPPYPTMRELAGEAIAELAGWDGKISATLKVLLRQPGRLTIEFLEGHRARYLSPLRLYLMASLAYFVIDAAAPHTSKKDGLNIGFTSTPAAAKATSAPQRVGDAVSRSLKPRVSDPDPDPDPNPGNTKAPLTAEEKAAALKDVERAPTILRPFVRRAIEDPAGLKRGILETMPRMLFVLLPIFAGIVAIFYRGRRYPEHLYFAIHLHAFIFLALAIAALVKFTRLSPLVTAAGTLALLWVPVYATLAFRRTYGGAVGRTLAKEVGIGAIYSVASIVALLVTAYWVALYG